MLLEESLVLRFGGKAYAENLKIVLSYVAFLVSKLSGNAITTADLGEFWRKKNVGSSAKTV